MYIFELLLIAVALFWSWKTCLIRCRVGSLAYGFQTKVCRDQNSIFRRPHGRKKRRGVKRELGQFIQGFASQARNYLFVLPCHISEKRTRLKKVHDCEPKPFISNTFLFFTFFPFTFLFFLFLSFPYLYSFLFLSLNMSSIHLYQGLQSKHD